MSSKMTQVGVAWKKTTQQDNKTFLSAVLTNPTGPDIHLSIWPNGFKEKENQPDYIIYKSADERPQSAKKPVDDGFPTEQTEEEVPF